MAHYDEIRRKSVVDSCLSPRKANKINGLLVQGLHRRDIRNAFSHILVYREFILLFVLAKPLMALVLLAFSCCAVCCFCRTNCRSSGTTEIINMT